MSEVWGSRLLVKCLSALLDHYFYLCCLQVGLYFLILYRRKLSHWNLKGLQLLTKKHGQNCD